MNTPNLTEAKIEVPLEEALEVFAFLVEMNQFLHQPMNYTPKRIEEFSSQHYPTLHRLVYYTVRDWIPEDVMERLCDE